MLDKIESVVASTDAALARLVVEADEAEVEVDVAEEEPSTDSVYDKFLAMLDQDGGPEKILKMANDGDADAIAFIEAITAEEE
jgi:hypothetical protein